MRSTTENPGGRVVPPDAVLKSAYDRCERLIEDRYGIGVSIADVLEPNTGDFDGLRIQVDYGLDLEAALFVLVHLFGHTAQWNTSEMYRKLGYSIEPGRSEEELAQIHDYERDATRISLQLMHEAGVKTLDQWVSDWWHADWRYLAHFYRTAEKLDIYALFEPGQPVLTPLPIPEFQPQRWISRWSF